jgi:lysozyme
MAMNGIDISSYQSGLNLGNVSYDFVLIKATEGVSYVNPMCDTHFQEAKAAGKKRAVYHFTNFGDAIAEANFFVDNCVGYIRDAIFVLDWEGAGVGATDWALRFLQQVESRIGYKPAIYMSEWVENHYDWSAVVANDNGLWAAKYADYEIDNNYDMSNAGQPVNLVHWPFYFMWQWTSKGRLNGYAGDLDCDIAYLNGNQWDAYAGVQQAPEQTTTTTTTAPVVPEPTTTTTTTAAVEPTPPPTSTTTTTQPTTTTTVINDPLPPVTTKPPVVTPKPTYPPVLIGNEVQQTVSLGEAVLARAVKTFMQTFLAIFVPTITGLTSGLLSVHTLSDLKAFALSTALAVIAAALSAVTNTLSPPKEVTK